MRLAWVSARRATGLDLDEPIALAALREAGVDVEVPCWDDASVAWASFDRAVIRSTWDYTDRLPEFLAWATSVGEVTELVNPAEVVAWNTDKHYLAELSAAGVPTIATEFLEPGDPVDLLAGALVVKPAVGAGSRDVAAYLPGEHTLARKHAQRLLDAGRSVLVQPLLTSVAAEGEWPLVFFGGRYSHSASKRIVLPKAGEETGLYVPETTATHTADRDQVAVAEAALEVVVQRFGTPAYARVDLVRGQDGPLVLELELVEPSLFLLEGGPGAVANLVAALV